MPIPLQGQRRRDPLPGRVRRNCKFLCAATTSARPSDVTSAETPQWCRRLSRIKLRLYRGAVPGGLTDLERESINKRSEQAYDHRPAQESQWAVGAIARSRMGRWCHCGALSCWSAKPESRAIDTWYRKSSGGAGISVGQYGHSYLRATIGSTLAARRAGM